MMERVSSCVHQKRLFAFFTAPHSFAKPTAHIMCEFCDIYGHVLLILTEASPEV